MNLSVHEIRQLHEAQASIQAKFKKILACEAASICSFDVLIEFFSQVNACQNLIEAMWRHRYHDVYGNDNYDDFHAACWELVNAELQKFIKTANGKIHFIKNVNWDFAAEDESRRDTICCYEVKLLDGYTLSWNSRVATQEVDDLAIIYVNAIKSLIDKEADVNRRQMLEKEWLAQKINCYLNMAKHKIERYLDMPHANDKKPYELGYLNLSTATITYDSKKYYVPRCIRDIYHAATDQNKHPYDKLKLVLQTLKDKRGQSGFGKGAATMFGRGRSQNTQSHLTAIAEILVNITADDLAQMEVQQVRAAARR